MDKLGFVKTFEAILAGLIALSLYSFIQSNSVSQIQTIERPLTSELNDFLDSINLYEVVNDYDYLKLDYYFNRLFLDTVYYYFEPVYYKKISVESSINGVNNVTFIYHFPAGIDKNSIRIMKDDYYLNTSAQFNWYYAPVIFNESLTNAYVAINISSSINNVNNNSFRFFVNNHETMINLDYWNNSNGFNASLIVFIPSINSNEKAYLMFSKGGSVNNTYYDFSSNKEVNYTVFSASPARTAEVTFKSELEKGSNEFFIKYSLFSDSDNNYKSISPNTSFNVITNNNLLWGSTPINSNLKGSYGVKRVIPIINGFVELNVYGDYI